MAGTGAENAVTRRAPPSGSLVTPPTGTDVDASELLDLDTSFGLSAFGSEQPRDAVETAPVPEPDRRFGHIEVKAPAHPVAPAPGRPVDAGAAAADVPAVHAPASHPTLTPAAGTHEAFEADYLSPFDEGTDAPPARLSSAAAASSRRLPWVLPATAALVVLTLLTGTAWLLWRPAPWLLWRPAPAVTSGELTINSTPDGARVIIGGKDRGTTPLSLKLEPGRYNIELRADDDRHMVPVQVNAGATTAQHVFLRKPAPPPVGTLRVVSEPPSATVVIDGRHRGTTPAQITNLPVGGHEVVVRGTGGRTARQRVQVSPGVTTTVRVPLPAPAPPQSTGGWLSISAPTELQVFEGDRLVGTTRVNPLMLPTGTHTLRLSSEAAGVDLTRVVSVERGKTARLQITDTARDAKRERRPMGECVNRWAGGR